MKSNDTVLVFVLFPALEKYIGEFLCSIDKQTDKRFDVLYFDDGYEKSIVLSNEISVSKITSSGSQLSPFENRWKLILEAKRLGYKNLIFCDADDVMSCHRVSMSIETLTRTDIFVTDLDVFREQTIFRKNLFGSSSIDFNSIDIFSLLEGNFIGLTNSAFRLDCLNFDLSGYNAQVFDWLFFSLLVLNGSRVEFVSGDVNTLYRVSNDNMIGLGLPEDTATLINMIDLKKKHFEMLLELLASLSVSVVTVESKIIEILIDLDILRSEIKNDNDAFKRFSALSERYVGSCYNGWWSNIKSIENLERALNGNV